MRGVPRERRAISSAPVGVDRDRQQLRRARDDARQLLGDVELEPRDDAEAVAQRIGQHAGARRRADQRERRQVELHAARRRPFADHDVDLEVLERRIEDLLDDRRQPMDLVDEQHVARLEVGEQRGEIARALEHRARRLAQVHAELVRDDVRQRRLAEARRAEQQHVIERLAALARRLDEDAELLADLLLADVFVEAARAQRALDDLFLRARGLGGDDARQFVVFDRHPASGLVRRRRRNATVVRGIIGHAFASSLQRLPDAVGDGDAVGQLLDRGDCFLLAVAERQQRIAGYPTWPAARG